MIRISDTALALAACFGVDRPLPFPIPVWCADVNCEKEPYPAELLALDSASGNGVHKPDYARLKGSVATVPAINIFLRGEGYPCPKVQSFTDEFGTFRQPAQATARLGYGDDDGNTD
jgi:hypothetical protein